MKLNVLQRFFIRNISQLSFHYNMSENFYKLCNFNQIRIEYMLKLVCLFSAY